jgi:hypothetical protein
MASNIGISPAMASSIRKRLRRIDMRSVPDP